MAAYIVARFDVKDWDKFREYGKNAPRTIAKFGGRFIARGGETLILEGPQEGYRVVLIEFPSLEKAKTYFISSDYTETKKLREGAAEARIVAVDGFDPSAWAGVVADSEALAKS